MNRKSLDIVLTQPVRISSEKGKRMKGNLLQMFLYRSLNMILHWSDVSVLPFYVHSMELKKSNLLFDVIMVQKRTFCS